MKSQTVEVPLSTQILQRLDERVRLKGTDRARYISDVLVRDLQTPTLSEILAPFRKQDAQSGITDIELDELFERARDEANQARNSSVNE